MATSSAAQNENLPLARFAIPDHVASRSFPTETVLLNLNTGQYHGLNPTGGRMLEVVGECGDFERAASQLATELEQPLETVRVDLRELCQSLLQRGLLEVVPS
ncbi:MAG TPA: PqqD family protein [Solirubrobacterales bacterium]|nr:PqqD family protein [Solirubrobacterales bacterium]